MIRCTVVLLNTRKGQQSHLLNTSRKTVVCLAYSPDGKYLVTGECGHQPALRVWDMSQPSLPAVAELMGHKYGVNCVVSALTLNYFFSFSFLLKDNSFLNFINSCPREIPMFFHIFMTV